MAFIYIHFFFEKVWKSWKNCFFRAKFFLHCTLSVILGDEQTNNFFTSSWTSSEVTIMIQVVRKRSSKSFRNIFCGLWSEREINMVNYNAFWGLCELIAQRLPSNKFLFMWEIVRLLKIRFLHRIWGFSVFVTLKPISTVFKWLEN